MKQQTDTPLYATVFYEARKKLDISWNEYIYLDMVQKLHIHQKWCTKSLESCARDLGITKRGVSKMKERLIDKGLLERSMRGHLKVTPKYTEIAVNKVHRLENKAVNLVPKSVNKVPSAGELSSTKNYNRTTKINKESYKKAREASAKVRASLRLLKTSS